MNVYICLSVSLKHTSSVGGAHDELAGGIAHGERDLPVELHVRQHVVVVVAVHLRCGVQGSEPNR